MSQCLNVGFDIEIVSSNRSFPSMKNFENEGFLWTNQSILELIGAAAIGTCGSSAVSTSGRSDERLTKRTGGQGIGRPEFLAWSHRARVEG